MEVGGGTVQRKPFQRIYRCVSSTLRITGFPVCYRTEITSFSGQETVQPLPEETPALLEMMAD
jgi:hypothetical protein